MHDDVHAPCKVSDWVILLTATLVGGDVEVLSDFEYRLRGLVGTRSSRELPLDDIVAEHQRDAARTRFRKMPAKERLFLLQVCLGAGLGEEKVVIPSNVRRPMIRAITFGRWQGLEEGLRALEADYPDVGFKEAAAAIYALTTNVLDNR